MIYKKKEDAAAMATSSFLFSLGTNAPPSVGDGQLVPNKGRRVSAVEIN